MGAKAIVTLAVVCLLAGALRYGLFYVGLTEVLENSYEINTPVNSLKRLKEAVWLKNRGSSPYAGSVFHNSPLALIAGEVVFGLPEAYQPFAFIGADILAAIFIAVLVYSDKFRLDQAKEGKDRYGEPSPSSSLAFTAVSLYLFNPFTIMNCVSQTTQGFDNLLVISVFATAAAGLPLLPGLFLALASFSSPYYIVLVIPTVMYVNKRSGLVLAVLSLLAAAAGLFGLFNLSYELLGHNFEFVDKYYWFLAYAEDATPNIGLFWYFFTEMFAPFRTFFMFVLQYHIFIYVVPVSIRFKSYPLVAMWGCLAIACIFKPYPAFGDVALYLGLLPVLSHLLHEMQYAVLGALVTPFICVLLPVMWRMWIWTGTGNANFYFALTLVISVVQSLFVVDVFTSTLKRDFLIRNPMAKSQNDKVVDPKATTVVKEHKE